MSQSAADSVIRWSKFYIFSLHSVEIVPFWGAELLISQITKLPLS